jgi:hypothetical protein
MDTRELYIKEFFNSDEKTSISEVVSKKETSTAKSEILKKLYGNKDPVYYDSKAHIDLNAFRGSKIAKTPAKSEYKDFMGQIKAVIDGIVKVIEDKKLLPNKMAFVIKVWTDFYAKVSDPDSLSADIIYPFFEKGKKHLEEIYYNIITSSDKDYVKAVIEGLHVSGILDMCGSGTFTKLETFAESLQTPSLTPREHFYLAVKEAVEAKASAFYNDHILDKWPLATVGNEVHYVNLLLDFLIDNKLLPIILSNKLDPLSFELPPIPTPLLEKFREQISQSPLINDDILRIITNKYFTIARSKISFAEIKHFSEELSSNQDPKLFILNTDLLYGLYEKDEQNHEIYDPTAYTKDSKLLCDLREQSGSPKTVRTVDQIKDIIKMSILLTYCEQKIIPPGNVFQYALDKNILTSWAVTFLVEAKACNVNIRYKNSTPLHIALENNYPIDVINALIEAKANTNAHDYAGRTPLTIAVLSGNLKSVNALLEVGVNPNVVPLSGIPPLHTAIKQKHVDIILALIKAKADLNKASNGLTPLSVAESTGNIEIVKLLLSLLKKGPGLFYNPVLKVCHSLVPIAWLDNEDKFVDNFNNDFSAWLAIPKANFIDVLFNLLSRLSEEHIGILLAKLPAKSIDQLIDIAKSKEYATSLSKITNKDKLDFVIDKISNIISSKEKQVELPVIKKKAESSIKEKKINVSAQDDTDAEIAIQTAKEIFQHLEMKGCVAFPRIDSKNYRKNDPDHNSKQPLDHLQIEFDSLEDRNNFENYVIAAGGEVMSRQYTDKATGKVKQYDYTATKRDGRLHAYAQVKIGFFYNHTPGAPVKIDRGKPVKPSFLHSFDHKKVVEIKSVNKSIPTKTWDKFKQKYAKKEGDINLILESMIIDLKSIPNPGDPHTIIMNLIQVFETLPIPFPSYLSVNLPTIFEKALAKYWDSMEKNMVKYAVNNRQIASTVISKRIYDSNINFYNDIDNLLILLKSLRESLPKIPDEKANTEALKMLSEDFRRHPLTRMVWDEYLESQDLPTSIKPPLVLHKLSDEDRLYELFKLYIKLISIKNIYSLSEAALNKKFSKIIQESIFKNLSPLEAPDLYEILSGLYDRLHQIDSINAEKISNTFKLGALPPSLKKGETFTWASAIERYLHRKGNAYQVLLQLSNEMEQANIKFLNHEDEAKLKSIMDTLPASSVNIGLHQNIKLLNETKLIDIKKYTKLSLKNCQRCGSASNLASVSFSNSVFTGISIDDKTFNTFLNFSFSLASAVKFSFSIKISIHVPPPSYVW